MEIDNKIENKPFSGKNPCPFCGYELKYEERYPPVYDENIKSWKLDDNGIIFQDKTKPKIKVPWCECRHPYRLYFL